VQCLQKQRIHTVDKISNDITVMKYELLPYQFPEHCGFTWPAYAGTCLDSCCAQGSNRRDTLCVHIGIYNE